MGLRAVLFDFGRTLFDVRAPGELIAGAARACGVEVDPARALAQWERIAAESVTPEELAKQRDISEEAHRRHWVRLLAPLDALCDGMAEAMYAAKTDAENWQAYPDTPSTLEALERAGIPVVVVSDTGFDIRPVFARHLGSPPPVHEFVLSFEHGAVKPAPVLFDAALRAAGVAPGEALMVGDNATTDGGAAALGIPVLLLPPPAAGRPRGLDAVVRMAGGRVGGDAGLAVEPFRPELRDAVIELIVGIQRDEFAIPITAADQPDLQEIGSFYQTGYGNFWVARCGGEVVGTIALLDIGAGQGALRKMFVRPDHRGPGGAAEPLLDALLRWSARRPLREIFLGTTSKFVAAHRFYEKHGFTEIAKSQLPGRFPVMDVDTKFYHRRLAAG